MIVKRATSLLIMLSMLFATIIVVSPSVQAHTESDPMVVDLIAGGGNPKSAMTVGNVSVWNDAEYLYVQFNTFEDCYITETHLAVGDQPSDIPQTKKGNPIPGQFENKNESHDAWEQSYTYEIPLDEAWVPCETDVFIAAHAVVCCLDWELGPELVTNGDFEFPVVDTPQLWDIYDNGTSGLGWAVEWHDGATSYGGWERPDPAHLELHRGVNGWLPNTGDQYAELDTDWDGPGGGLTNEPASVNISQDLSTGQYCQVGFSWSPRPDHDDNQMEVYWEDGLLFGLSSPGDSNTIWCNESVILRSTEEVSTLAFVETGNADSLGMFLDSVSVRCFPCQTAWGDGEDFPGNNWAMYFGYHIQPHLLIWPPDSGTLTIAYEDQRIGQSDYDYNDFVVATDISAHYSVTGIMDISLEFEAMARGAAWHHNFMIQIPADTFGSDGDFTVEYYDKAGGLLGTGGGTFDSDTLHNFMIFGNTWSAIEPNPGQSWSANTFDGSGTQDGRVTVLTIVFDDYQPFDLSTYNPVDVGVHGDNLFFNPVLHVQETGNNIDRGDERTLLVPMDWQWPQETWLISDVYPGVNGDPPSFDDPYWYENAPNDYIWTP